MFVAVMMWCARKSAGDGVRNWLGNGRAYRLRQLWMQARKAALQRLESRSLLFIRHWFSAAWQRLRQSSDAATCTSAVEAATARPASAKLAIIEVMVVNIRIGHPALGTQRAWEFSVTPFS